MIRVCIVVICLSGLSACNGVFFAPMKRHVMTPEKVGLKYEDWYIQVDQNTLLHGWYLPAGTAPKGTVLFLHGNGENISTHIAAVYWLPKNGYNVLLYDYRGYGKSQGFSTIDNAIGDVPRVVARLREKIGSEKMIMFGQSMGGVIALNALVDTGIRGQFKAVIIESSFSGFRRIAREKLSEVWFTWLFQWPLSLMITADYSPLEAIAALSPLPVLIVHGTADRLVPYHHGEALFKAARQPKQFWTVEKGRHIQFVMSEQRRRRLLNYLSSLE